MLVYFAVLLTVLLGFCGLAIDVGRVELRELQLQGAADDAAVSSAAQLQQGDSNWQQAASAEATAYLAANGIPVATVDTPVQGPASGAYAGDQSVVQVTLHQTMPTVFLGLIEHGSSSVALSASAMARLPPCAYFTAKPPVNVGSSNQRVGVYLAGTAMSAACPVWTSTGWVVDGSSSVNGGPAGSAGASGAAGGSQIQGQVSPAMSYLTPQQSDPLAYVQAPAFAQCDHKNMSYTGTATLSPGTWCGGLNASGATLTLQPGLYVITGGAVWSNSTISGTGVTLYFTQGGGSGFGTFSLISQSTMKLSAPLDATNGGIPGVVLFGDRAWSGSSADFLFDSSSVSGDGIFYTTGTGIVDRQCNMSGPNYFSMVTANLYSLGATIGFSGNYNSLAGGSPLHNNISLVQ